MNDEQVDQRRDRHDDRHGDAEEHVGDERRLAAQTGHPQRVLQVVGLEGLAQVQLVDQLLHEAFRRLAQLAARTAVTLGLHVGEAHGAHLVALGRHRLHALRGTVALQDRHRDRQNGRESRDRRQHHDQELRLHHHRRRIPSWQYPSVLFGHQLGGKAHAQYLKLIIFFMTRMPIVIQHAAAQQEEGSRLRRPEDGDVAGRRQIDEQHHDRTAGRPAPRPKPWLPPTAP